MKPCALFWRIKKLTGLILSRIALERSFLRLPLKKNPAIAGRTVEIAPLNQGGLALEKFFAYCPRMMRKIIPGAAEWVEKQNHYQELPYPPRVGVIAGAKNFKWNGPEFYLIKILCGRMADSDGKLLIAETKFAAMADFVLLKENHTDLISNKKVFQLTRNFLAAGNFAGK